MIVRVSGKFVGKERLKLSVLLFPTVAKDRKLKVFVPLAFRQGSLANDVSFGSDTPYLPREGVVGVFSCKLPLDVPINVKRRRRNILPKEMVNGSG